jgi:hypothetical protein
MNKSVLGAVGRRVMAPDRREMRNLLESLISDLVEEKCKAYFAKEEKIIAGLRLDVDSLRKCVETHESKLVTSLRFLVVVD